MTHRRLFLSMALLVFVNFPVSAQNPQGKCGDRVTVLRSDTLSSIAERCSVDESQILRLNPGIRRSADLIVGSELRLAAGVPSSKDGVDRLGSAAREAGEALADIARDLGATIEDLLRKNPDLSERLRRLGEPFDFARPDLNSARVTIAPEAGPTETVVTVSATGLPKEVPVKIGLGGMQSAYEIVDRARTDTNGALRISVTIPSWAGDRERIVIVISGENDQWRVRSSPYRITGTTL